MNMTLLVNDYLSSHLSPHYVSFFTAAPINVTTDVLAVFTLDYYSL